MFDLQEIRRLLDAFEASDWDEVHLVADGVELHVSANADGPGAALPSPAAPPAAIASTSAPPAIAAPATTATPPSTGADPGQAVPPPAPGAHSTPQQIPDASELEGLHAVVSPSPGIFWRSPAPGEPPFTDVGQQVGPETPIGIVEVMKLMNQVLAGVTGTVKAVLVENGARVDRDQPLVLVELDA